MRKLILAVVVVEMAAGSAAQSSWTPTNNVQGNTEAFVALRSQWAQLIKEKNVQACVEQYAADAVFVQPDGSRVTGAAEITKLFETITATFDSNLVFKSQKVDVNGNEAVDTGSYREVLTTRATGKQTLYWGGYVTKYRKQADGGWLIASQSWTSAGKPIALDLSAHPVVALTFDDLPTVGKLPAGDTWTGIATRLAGELREAHLTGTYGFVNAAKLENNADAERALHAWLDAGMNIGSHTWSHISLTDNSAESFEHEIDLNEPALAQYGEMRDWHWFRYPFLWEGDTVEKRRAVRAYLKERGYRIAEVTLDFEDYAWNDAYARCAAKQDAGAIEWLKQSYLETAAEYVKLGREEQIIASGHEVPNVMLLHATAFTTLMLPKLMEQLRDEGFSFEGLAQVESDPAYSIDPDAGLKYGGTLPDQMMDSRQLIYPPFAPKPFKKLAQLCE
jgi:peptidoglycan-N-acetylglucosamine deacetylase